jgi:type IV pilus assembly protein PilW
MAHRTPRRSSGFTLVEILIALLIGLVAVIVIMQTYAVSEGFKRTSTSGADAQTNGGVALYLVERELRMAGYGFNAIPNCASVIVYNSPTGQTKSLPVWPPIQVNPAGVAAGDANTDVVLVAYGSADDFGAPVQASQTGTGNAQTSDYAVAVNYTAFRTGDMLVAYNVGGLCYMTEVTAGNWASGTCTNRSKSSGYNLVSHGTGSYYSTGKNCAQVTPTHNPSGGVSDPAGSGVVAPLGTGTGYVYNLGPSPQIKAYAIMGGNLSSCDLLQQNCAVAANFTVVMNDVVSLRMLYGQADQYGNVKTWSRNPMVAAPGATDGPPAALAVQVTARNTLKEKPKGSGGCDATAVNNLPDRGMTTDWYNEYTPNDGTLAAAKINLSTISADWQCYRYKLFQTAVPLRNAIWTPTILNPPSP